jgi:hypothetical protein
MTPFAQHLCRLGAAAAIILSAATLPATAEAGPFSGLDGQWTGGGHIKLSDGTQERIRCRASYAVGNGGTMLQQALRCASDSYNFELRSDVESHGSRISGNWNELTRNIGGTVSGHGRSGHIDVAINNPNFSASLTLSSHGDHQSVTIRSKGTAFAGATVSLRRSRRSASDR